ncbi:MAG: hypothetical protein AB7L09_01600 [Nitrospira sp.]
MLISLFPENYVREFDDIAWRIGRLVGRAGYGDSGPYVLVFHSSPLGSYDGLHKRVRFAAYRERLPIIVVTIDHVLEWGSDDEIDQLIEHLRRETLLDEMASC